MEFTGLLGAYPKQHILTEQERQHQLKQGHRLNVEPHYQLSVIKMNSSFLETVDKWFAWKGVITGFAAFLICLFSYGVVVVGFCSNVTSWSQMDSTERLEQIMFSTFICAISLPFIVCGLWMLRKESFALTHYPIRFNCKTRIVHVFRTDGSVLSVPWSEIFFTLGHLPAWNEWEVRGYVLEKDGITVRETFALSYVGSIDSSDVTAEVGEISSSDFVRAHWEFVRRYMEEGPESVSSQVQFCMPIDERRENVGVSLERIFANIAGAPIFIYYLLAPICMGVFFFRVIAMRTSKVPVWPIDIDTSGRIEPGDPFAIKGNLRGDRVALFPDAALAAGVGFQKSADKGKNLSNV